MSVSQVRTGRGSVTGPLSTTRPHPPDLRPSGRRGSFAARSATSACSASPRTSSCCDIITAAMWWPIMSSRKTRSSSSPPRPARSRIIGSYAEPARSSGYHSASQPSIERDLRRTASATTSRPKARIAGRSERLSSAAARDRLAVVRPPSRAGSRPRSVTTAQWCRMPPRHPSSATSTSSAGPSPGRRRRAARPCRRCRSPSSTTTAAIDDRDHAVSSLHLPVPPPPIVLPVDAEASGSKGHPPAASRLVDSARLTLSSAGGSVLPCPHPRSRRAT